MVQGAGQLRGAGSGLYQLTQFGRPDPQGGRNPRAILPGAGFELGSHHARSAGSLKADKFQQIDFDLGTSQWTVLLPAQYSPGSLWRRLLSAL